MSRIQRVQAKQGHPVPSRAMPTQGPFPRDMYSSLPVNTEYKGVSGNGGPEIPMGSTAQNNYKSLRWFRCTLCSEVMTELDMKYHICEDDDTPTPYIPGIGDDEYDDGRVY